MYSDVLFFFATARPTYVMCGITIPVMPVSSMNLASFN